MWISQRSGRLSIYRDGVGSSASLPYIQKSVSVVISNQSEPVL